MAVPVSAWRDNPAWMVRCPMHGVLYRGPHFSRALTKAIHGEYEPECVEKDDSICSRARMYWQGQLVHEGTKEV